MLGTYGCKGVAEIEIIDCSRHPELSMTRGDYFLNFVDLSGLSGFVAGIVSSQCTFPIVPIFGGWHPSLSVIHHAARAITRSS